VLAESGIDPSEFVHAMLGTTHSTNAIVERKGLARIGVVRLAAPSGLSIPPYVEWPADFLDRIGTHYRIVKGGYEYNGAPLGKPDRDEIEGALLSLKKERIEALAVSCVFAPVNGEQENLVRSIARNVFGEDFTVSLSSEIGSIGLLERENATIINAAISRIPLSAYSSFRNVLRRHGITADLFINQNDGTLMSVDYACRYPVFTIASGPTNSLRGAAFLSGLSDAVVVDVGGTTTDVGILRKGFPRESTTAVEIGGIRTNFRMPDLISIGLGGGSHVRPGKGGVKVGPESVGYRITKEALVFGGKTLTATDVAVAAGMYSLGDSGKLSHLDKRLVRDACERMREMVEEVIDRMKTASEEMPVITVGGGSILLPDRLKGAKQRCQTRELRRRQRHRGGHLAGLRQRGRRLRRRDEGARTGHRGSEGSRGAGGGQGRRRRREGGDRRARRDPARLPPLERRPLSGKGGWKTEEVTSSHTA
jgi:N-methylhydantoinase A/oxoprolinase/acetone carboxylase beta subunit